MSTGFRLNLGGLNPGVDVGHQRNTSSPAPPPQHQQQQQSQQQSQGHSYQQQQQSHQQQQQQQQQVPPFAPRSGGAYNRGSQQPSPSPVGFNNAQSSERGSLVPLSSDRHGSGSGVPPVPPLSARGAAAGAATTHIAYGNVLSGAATAGGGNPAATLGLGLDASELLGVAAHDIADIEVLRKQLDKAQKLFVALEKRYESALRDQDRYYMGLLDEMRSSAGDGESARYSTQSGRRSGDVSDVATQTYTVTSMSHHPQQQQQHQQHPSHYQQTVHPHHGTAPSPQPVPTSSSHLMYTSGGAGGGGSRFAGQQVPVSTRTAQQARIRPSSGAASARAGGGYTMGTSGGGSRFSGGGGGGSSNKYTTQPAPQNRAPLSSRGGRSEPLLPSTAMAAMRSPRGGGGSGGPGTSSSAQSPATAGPGTGGGGNFRPFRPAVPTIGLSSMLHQPGGGQ